MLERVSFHLLQFDHTQKKETILATCFETDVVYKCTCIVQLHSLFPSLCKSCTSMPQTWTTKWGNEKRWGLHTSNFLERWKANE